MLAIDEATKKELIEVARQSLEKAYAPYSRFRVGAAVLAGSGRIYQGCNIENASYGLSVCAERSAIFNAVAAGEKEISAVAVVCSENRAAFPCGACRQVISEFSASPEQVQILLVADQHIEEYTLADLLPYPFKL